MPLLSIIVAALILSNLGYSSECLTQDNSQDSVIITVQSTKQKVINLSKSSSLDLSLLKKETQAESLILTKADIDNLDFLKEFKKLEYLDISHTKITNLEPLRSLTTLKILNISNTNITSIAPIASLSNLKELYASNLGVFDEVVISTLRNLERLTVRGNKIRSVRFLSTLNKLAFVSVCNNDIDTLELDGLYNLQTILANDNKINSIVFRNLPSLNFLSLDNNCLSLNQLHSVMHIKNLYLGRQEKIKFNHLPHKLIINKEYSLVSDEFFEQSTLFSVCRENSIPATESSDYLISHGKIRFLTPGWYVIGMINPEVHSKGMISANCLNTYGLIPIGGLPVAQRSAVVRTNPFEVVEP